MQPLRLSVVVPTFRRSEPLGRCLSGLRSQIRTADEVIVVRHISDREAAAAIASFPEVTEATVAVPGGLAPLQAGIARAAGDVIAFIDDDAVPRLDWLDRIARWMEDPGLGGIGGRDIIHAPGFNAAGEPGNGLTADVGRITSFGRLVGNHHRGIGPARDVEVLKGVNMAFRREALALPVALQGRGSQLHWEIATCLWGRQRGWRLTYDPLLRVDHFPAVRPHGDQRVRPPFGAIRDGTHNYVAALLTFQPGLRWRRFVYGMLVGGKGDPGLGRAIIALLTADFEVVRRLPPSVLGQIDAMLELARGNGVRMVETPARQELEAAGSR